MGLVLTIWGVIGFRVASTINPSEKDSRPRRIDVAFNPNIHTEIDTFSIQSLDRDPFLGTLYKEKPNPNIKQTKPKEPIAWPTVVYHGMISKQESKVKICVLSIDGKQNIVKLNQTSGGIKLLRANNEEALIEYKNQRKTIPKS